MTTILRFILFFLVAPAFAIVAQVAGAVQEDIRIVYTDVRADSVLLESVDGEIFNYDLYPNVVQDGFKGLNKSAANKLDNIPNGSFNITEQGFRGYPDGVPRPQGPFRLVEGAEYDAARSAANRANNQIRIDSNLRGQPVDVHKISPVKFNGFPTDPANKIILDRNLHRQQVTPWWNQLQRDIGG